MGGITCTALEDVLTPIWHDGTLGDLPQLGGRPLLWSLRLDSRIAAAMAAHAPIGGDELGDLARGPNSGPRVLRRRLMKALIAYAASVHPATVVLGRAAHGAIVVHSPQGWHASVAGREAFCLLGIASVPLGVDIEPINFNPPLWDMLTVEEREELRALDDIERPREWLRRWTAKEAHAKLLGLGLAVDPKAIATTPLSDSLLTCSFAGSSACWTRQSNGHLQAAAFWSPPHIGVPLEVGWGGRIYAA
jgi:4'-phosphopantetheinyl transferase